jgi:hypothetical protein
LLGGVTPGAGGFVCFVYTTSFFCALACGAIIQIAKHRHQNVKERKTSHSADKTIRAFDGRCMFLRFSSNLGE